MAFEDLSFDDAPDLSAEEKLVAERQARVTQEPMLQDPAFVKADCSCRGGRWQGGDTGFCVPPSVPTGKYYDVAGRSCAPIPGRAQQAKTSWCHYRNVNVCLVGGLIVAGLAVTYWLKTRKKA